MCARVHPQRPVGVTLMMKIQLKLLLNAASAEQVGVSDIVTSNDHGGVGSFYNCKHYLLLCLQISPEVSNF